MKAQLIGSISSKQHDFSKGWKHDGNTKGHLIILNTSWIIVLHEEMFLFLGLNVL